MPSEPSFNAITDLAGIRVGHAHDSRIGTGVTAILFDDPNVASGVMRGGAPGSRDFGVLEPEMSVESIDAVVLSGGSAFGLDAAGGVMSLLKDAGRGIKIGPALVPIVVQAITFDLLNGGDKGAGRKPIARLVYYVCATPASLSELRKLHDEDVFRWAVARRVTARHIGHGASGSPADGRYATEL